MSASTRSGRVRGRPRPRPRHPDAVQHRLELRAVAALAGGDHDRQRLLALLAGQVQLGGQPAPGAAQRRGRPARCRLRPAARAAAPPLRAPAACWWARAIVESTLTSQVISPAASAWACSAVRIRARCRHAASAGTGRTPSARARSGRARPATAPRSGSASGSRRSAAVCSRSAAGRTSCPWAAAAPAGPLRVGQVASSHARSISRDTLAFETRPSVATGNVCPVPARAVYEGSDSGCRQ